MRYMNVMKNKSNNLLKKDSILLEIQNLLNVNFAMVKSLPKDIHYIKIFVNQLKK